MARNIERIYNDIFRLRECLEDAISKAKNIANESKEFQGMISNVMTEQMSKYFIPGISKFIKDIETPGSISGIVKFLDAVPLAYTRDKENEGLLDPMIPENPDIEAPSGSSIDNDVSQLPLNASYNKPEGDEVASTNATPVAQTSTPAVAPTTPAATASQTAPEDEYTQTFDDGTYMESKEGDKENKLTEKIEKPASWIVVRKSKIKSALGDKLPSTNRKNVVYESNFKEKAEAKAEYLNSTVLPDEKEFLGTEYVVEEKNKD